MDANQVNTRDAQVKANAQINARDAQLTARDAQANTQDAQLNAQDERFMREALREADLARMEDEVPIGAVMVCRGRVIARGHNMTERLNDPTAHAEMICLTAACEALGGKYLDSCTLYVTVEPCPMCAAALAWAQIGRIVFGAEDPKRGYSLFRTQDNKTLLHPKTQVCAGLLSEECGTMVTNYFRNKR